jgi:hypothetical protein
MVVDHLNVEKKGIPTVFIATTSYIDLAISTMEGQGLGKDDMAYVVVPHPIGGLSEEEVCNKVDEAFPEILKAATEWQPSR